MNEGPEEKIKKSLKGFLEAFDIKLDLPEERERSETEIYGDYPEIVNKTQSKLDKLNQRSEELLEKAGMTREEMEVYISNPDNFTPEQWEALKNLKQAAEDLRKRTYKIAGQETVKKTIEKERKKQHQRFGKKKHWIPL